VQLRCLLETQKVNLKLSLFCFAACNLLVHRRLCQQIGDVVERIATHLKKRNLSAHTTLVFPNLMHVRASMPSICVCSIIVASYITRGLDTDLHVAGESFTNLSKPARVVLDQTLASPHLHAFHAFHIYCGCFWPHYPDSDVSSMCKHAIWLLDAFNLYFWLVWCLKSYGSFQLSLKLFLSLAQIRALKNRLDAATLEYIKRAAIARM
jgi:hypothetical protein